MRSLLMLARSGSWASPGCSTSLEPCRQNTTNCQTNRSLLQQQCAVALLLGGCHVSTYYSELLRSICLHWTGCCPPAREDRTTAYHCSSL
jgi:hypothetical protein